MRKVTGLLLLGLLGCNFNFNPGTGEKIGQVIRINNEGIFCKTWEGQLIRGGFSSGSGAMGVQPFDFTIPLEMVPNVEAAMRSQTEVRITYSIEGVYALCRSSSTGHFLTSISPLDSGLLVR